MMWKERIEEEIDKYVRKRSETNQKKRKKQQ